MQTATQTTQESTNLEGNVTTIEREIEAAIRGGGKYNGLPEALMTIDDHGECAQHGFEQMLATARAYTDEETVGELTELMFKKLGKRDRGDVVDEGEYARMKSFLSDRFATALLLIEDDKIEFRSTPHSDLESENVAPLSELAGEGSSPAVYVVTYEDGSPTSQYEMAEVGGMLVCGCPDKVYRYSRGLRRCKHELGAALQHVSAHTV